MTAAEWEASHDPPTMLRAAGKRIPERSLILFVSGAARRVADQFPVAAEILIPRIEAAADLPPHERPEALRVALLADSDVGGQEDF